MKYLFFLLSLLATALGTPALAQDQPVTGRVTDGATGQGLPGVAVRAQGTTSGTVTGDDGQFTLVVPASATTLQLSRLGYKAVEQVISAGVPVAVTMQVEARSLDEVVVTGLASTTTRATLAQAVSTVSAAELVGTTRPVTVDAALRGKVVGAVIAQTSGAPGGGMSIQLRGISTITGNSQPLYIIDGVYAIAEEVGNGAGSAAFTRASADLGRTTQDNGTNRVSDLNPDDIESIEILKGPSAAAMYGTRANAGVILIRTKRGVAGRTQVRLTQDVGLAQVSRLLGKEDWTPAKIDRLVARQAGTAQDQQERADREKARLAAAQASGRIYDYEREVFGHPAFLRNTSVSVAGGNDQTRFYLAGSTTDEAGIVRHTGYARSSLRTNVDQKIGRRLDLGVSSGYYYSTNRRGFSGNDNKGISLGYNLAQIPSYAELHPDPVTAQFPDSDYSGDNPLAIVARSLNEEATHRVTEAGTATVHLLERDRASVRLAAQGGIDFASSTARLALPADLQSQRSSSAPGVARTAKAAFFNYNFQGFLTYAQQVGERLHLTSQVGLVRLGLGSNLSYQQGQHLLPGPLVPNQGALVTQQVLVKDETDVGYVAQQEVNFRDQLIATGSVRFDKSSRNGDANKLYVFPRAALAVNVARFKLFAFKPVSQLKVRAAYGETGGPAMYGGTFTPLEPVSTGNRPGFVAGPTVGNPAVGPERATELEAGLDLGLFDNRLSLTATIYQKKVIDILNRYVTAPGTGVQAIPAFPVGDLRNRGLELTLSAQPVRTPALTWTSTTLFWLNRSEVTRLVVPTFTASPSYSFAGQTFFALGESPSRWFGRPADPTANVGNPGFLTRYGEAQPRFQMSFQHTFTLFRHLEAAFLLAWKQDSYTSNLTYAQTDLFGTTKDWSEDSGHQDAAGQPLTQGEYRQTRLTDGYLDNSGYVRLREAALYYALPGRLRTRLFGDYVQGLRVGISGNNLLTFTQYPGYDPEVSNFGQLATGAQVDVLPFPSTRRLFGHLTVEF